MSLLFHTHSLLHHHQFGFVHGGSCEAPIEVVNDTYEYAIEHDEQLHVAFLDATSAFDTVQHPALTAAFSSIGASTSFVQWIKFMVAGHPHRFPQAGQSTPLTTGSPQHVAGRPLRAPTVPQHCAPSAHHSRTRTAQAPQRPNPGAPVPPLVPPAKIFKWRLVLFSLFYIRKVIFFKSFF